MRNATAMQEVMGKPIAQATSSLLSFITLQVKLDCSEAVTTYRHQTQALGVHGHQLVAISNICTSKSECTAPCTACWQQQKTLHDVSSKDHNCVSMAGQQPSRGVQQLAASCANLCHGPHYQPCCW